MGILAARRINIIKLQKCKAVMIYSLFLLIILITGLLFVFSTENLGEEYQEPVEGTLNDFNETIQGLPDLVKDILPCKCDPEVRKIVCAGNGNFRNHCFLNCVNAVRRRLNQSELKIVCFAPCRTCLSTPLVNGLQEHEQNNKRIKPFNCRDNEKSSSNDFIEPRHPMFKPEELQNHQVETISSRTELETEAQQENLEEIPEIIRDLIPCRCSRQITKPVCAGDKNFQNRCFLACDNAVRRRLNQPELNNVCFASCDTCSYLKMVSLNEHKNQYNAERKDSFNNFKEHGPSADFRESRPPLFELDQIQNQLQLQSPTIDVAKEREYENNEPIPDIIRDLVPCRCNHRITNPVCAGEKNFQNRCFLACENAVRRRLNQSELNIVCFATCDSCQALNQIQQYLAKPTSIKPEEIHRKRFEETQYIKNESVEPKPNRIAKPSLINENHRLVTLKLSDILDKEGRIPQIASDLIPCKCNPQIMKTLCAGELNFTNQCYLTCENAVRSRLNIEPLTVVCYANCEVCDAIGPLTSSIETEWK